MFINRNSNVGKAAGIFGINRTSNNRNRKKNSHNNCEINFIIDELVESQYITRNFQIGLTYIQIAKSTLSEVKETLLEMKEILDKCKNQPNTSFGRETLSHKFIKLRDKFHNDSNKLNVDLRENLFYNNNNELVFKIFDSKSLEDCILIPKLNSNKFNLMGININNDINTKIADQRMSEVLDYILSSEKTIKNSEEKLSKVNLTDIMSANLLALSSNEDKNSIENLIDLTKKGIAKDNYNYNFDTTNKNIDDLLK